MPGSAVCGWQSFSVQPFLVLIGILQVFLTFIYYVLLPLKIFYTTASMQILLYGIPLLLCHVQIINFQTA